jgi:hypothetical protein
MPHLGHLDLAQLTTADIDDFYAHFLRAGRRDDRPLAPGIVARVHGVLHRALAQAVRWDWIWLSSPGAGRSGMWSPSSGLLFIEQDTSHADDGEAEISNPVEDSV